MEKKLYTIARMLIALCLSVAAGGNDQVKPRAFKPQTNAFEHRVVLARDQQIKHSRENIHVFPFGRGVVRFFAQAETTGALHL